MSTQGVQPQAAKPKLLVGDIWNFAWETFCTNKLRFVLTSLGMVLGTASLILVVTIGLTGKHYVLAQIQAIGANMIYAEYQSGGNTNLKAAQADYLTIQDLRAVQAQVPGIRAASPMDELHDRLVVGGGKERDILVLGVSPEYRLVRNLTVLAGRFFDEDDNRARSKVAVITTSLAKALYGAPEAAVGQGLELSGLPFVIIGTFKEGVDTFGQSEIAEHTILIPYPVSRYFRGNDAIKQLFFSVAEAEDVPQATAQIRQVLQSRHRPESVYDVQNLSQLLALAGRTANALSLVLLAIALVTLVVSGVGIMNIMLATVSSRIREIGIRKSIGATKREIRWQFLGEAIFISLTGGSVGIVIGLALPTSVRLLTTVHIPISGWSVVIALAVSSLVGIVFGTVPAARAANLDPVESLRQE
jgi:putative ABC transport system permease protein